MARAELTERGALFVSFHGAITPDALPRQAPAPISVNVAGCFPFARGSTSFADGRFLELDLGA